MNLHRPTTLVGFVSILALLAGLAATFLALQNRAGFWEDEIFPLAVQNVGFPEFFIAVPRLDMHPHVHYLQFKLWASLFESDLGALANSVAWHAISLSVIFLVGRAWGGTMLGLSAAALYAVVPQMIWASVTVRAYSMIPALAVLAWWANVRALRGTGSKAWAFALVALAELVLGYSHPIAFYFAAWIALGAAATVRAEGARVDVWRTWVLVQVIVGLLLLPLPISALVRGTEGATTGISAWDLPLNLGSILAGWGMKSESIRAVAAGLYLAVVALGLTSQRSRGVTVWILIVPFALAMLVSLTIAPMFKTPVYAAMLTPFLCLVAGAVVTESERARYAFVVVVSLMSVVAIPASQLLIPKESHWKELAAFLKRETGPGDVVVIPKPFAYWATMRYVEGPRWGSPFDVISVGEASRWREVAAKVGPKISHTLHLLPLSDHVVRDGVTFVIGEDARDESSKAKQIWLVEVERYPLDVALSPGFKHGGVQLEVGEAEPVRVTLLRR